MYPSISICKKYSFDLTYLNFADYEQEDVSTFVWWLNESTVGIEDQFYFFTLPGVKNLTFPCTTTPGGMTPGRPCVFPIYWDGLRRETCWKMETPGPACVTKTERGGHVYNLDNFGYCHANCLGEMPGPSSPFNLAALKHHQLWYSYFYDLSSFENGFCHTFNPPQKSVPGLENRMYFMIKNLSAYLGAYDIFLHENGQFWPRQGSIFFG